MKRLIKSTYPKILFLFLSSSIIFIILYFALYSYTKKTENQVYRTSKKQLQIEVNNILNLL